MGNKDRRTIHRWFFIKKWRDVWYIDREFGILEWNTARQCEALCKAPMPGLFLPTRLLLPALLLAGQYVSRYHLCDIHMLACCTISSDHECVSFQIVVLPSLRCILDISYIIPFFLESRHDTTSIQCNDEAKYKRDNIQKKVHTLKRMNLNRSMGLPLIRIFIPLRRTRLFVRRTRGCRLTWLLHPVR